MTMTIDQRHGDEAAMSPPATTDRRAVLRRMGDLKSVIARLKGTSSRLSAEGGSTEEIDRIIDILVSTLALIRGLPDEAWARGGKNRTVETMPSIAATARLDRSSKNVDPVSALSG